MKLRNRAARVRRVMDYAEGIDYVKAVVRKGQILGVPNCEPAVQVVDAKSLAGYFDAPGRQIDADDFRAGPSELQQVSASTASNLQQPLTRVPVESDYIFHPGRIGAVAIVFDAIEIETRSKGQVARHVGATWIGRPLLAGSPLVFVDKPSVCGRRRDGSGCKPGGMAGILV